jgi:recombinational DNA repair protein RecR
MRKPLCKCGHGRSVHQYIYYGHHIRHLSTRSPCKACDDDMTKTHSCVVYTPMDNLTLIEHLAKKKGLS